MMWRWDLLLGNRLVPPVGAYSSAGVGVEFDLVCLPRWSHAHPEALDPRFPLGGVPFLRLSGDAMNSFLLVDRLGARRRSGAMEVSIDGAEAHR